MTKLYISVLTAFCVFATGCVSSEDGVSSQDNEGGNTTCPSVADQCPSECMSVKAELIDVQMQCIQPLVGVGCIEPVEGGNSGIGHAEKVSDGRVYRLGSSTLSAILINSPEWQQVSIENTQTIQGISASCGL